MKKTLIERIEIFTSPPKNVIIDILSCESFVYDFIFPIFILIRNGVRPCGGKGEKKFHNDVVGRRAIVSYLVK